MKLYKISTYVPLSHADAIREVLAKSGAGKIGNYDATSFSVRGIGRFRPNEAAQPFIGKTGIIEEVEEERIETVCKSEGLKQVIQEIKKAHPYEEPVIDIWEIVDYKDFL